MLSRVRCDLAHESRQASAIRVYSSNILQQNSARSANCGYTAELPDSSESLEDLTTSIGGFVTLSNSRHKIGALPEYGAINAQLQRFHLLSSGSSAYIAFADRVY